MLKKTYSILSKIRAVAIVAVLAFVVCLCTAQITLRYFTSSALRPFAWGDEVIRTASIWVAFLAASLGVREGAHISVEFFVHRYLPPKAVGILKKCASVLMLAVLALLVWFGIVQTCANVNSSMQNLPISMAWSYAAIPVGCAYLFLDYLLIAVYGNHPFQQKAQRKNQSGGAEDPSASAAQ